MFASKKIAGSEMESKDEKKEFKPFERGSGRKHHKRGKRSSKRS